MKKNLQLAGLALALSLTLAARSAKATIQLPHCGDPCSPEGAIHGCLTNNGPAIGLKQCQCESGTWRC